MADLIYSRNIFDGGRKLIHSIVDVSDGTGYSAQMIDVGNLNTNAQGALCNRINLQKLWFNSNLPQQQTQLEFNGMLVVVLILIF